MDNNIIVEFKDLELSFKDPVTKYKKLVLDGVNLQIQKGKITGIIGESGSGKTVLTSLLTGNISSNIIIPKKSEINIYEDDNKISVQKWSQEVWEASKIRGLKVGQVFQNPMSTLTDNVKVGVHITESLIVNKVEKNIDKAYEIGIEMLKRVKINNPEEIMESYPFELSGGMNQRVALATILCLKPEIIILDEPTTALDTTVQAELLEIIRELNQQYGITFIYITHDIGVIASIADHVAIMYAGRVVEKATTKEILFNPQHPYTWGLLLSMPDLNTDESILWNIPGSVPSDISKIKGDSFAARNPYALEIDLEQKPPMFKVSETHEAATWLLSEHAPEYVPPQPILDRWELFKKGLI